MHSSGSGTIPAMAATAAPKTVRERFLAFMAQDHDLIQNPYPMYREALEGPPVIWLDDRMALLVRHPIVKPIFRDHETFQPPPTRTREFADSTSHLSEE